MGIYNKYRTKHIRSKLSKRHTRKQITVYKHPSIYQKPNEYGVGTYARRAIPANTIILRERPQVLADEPGDTYKFKLISWLLNNNRRDFLQLVPLNLDDTMSIDYETLRTYHETYLPDISRDEFMLYYYKYRRNAFSFDGKSVILFCATKLNHSCNPNVSYYKQDDEMLFETKRHISAGEQLFDAYINCTACKADRRAKLKQNYGFDCMCDKCNSET